MSVLIREKSTNLLIILQKQVDKVKVVSGLLSLDMGNCTLMLADVLLTQ